MSAPGICCIKRALQVDAEADLAWMSSRAPDLPSIEQNEEKHKPMNTF